MDSGKPLESTEGGIITSPNAEIVDTLTSTVPTVFKGFSDTASNAGIKIRKEPELVVNVNKPWREVIKRKIDYGGSNHEDLS